MLIISLVVSLFFLAGACAAYPLGLRQGGGLTVFLVSGFLAVLLSLALSPPVLLTALLLIVSGICCRSWKVHPGRFMWAALASTLFVYVGLALSKLPSVWERRSLREQYPLESLARRLEYERRAFAERVERRAVLRDQFPMQSLSERLSYQARPVDSESDAQRTKEISAKAADPRRFEQKLDELEQQLERVSWRRYRDRSEALRQIHSSHVQQFIDSPGFGVGRMVRMTEPEKYLPIDAAQTIPLLAGEVVDWDATPPQHSTARPFAADETPPTPAPTVDQLRYMYERGLSDFVNRRGWGYVKDRDHVAGFQAHHFREMPELPNSVAQRVSGFSFNDAPAARNSNRPLNTDAKQPWQVRRLELVSLLRHAEPSVYVSDALPRMDHVDEYEVRPLSAFEHRALQLLNEGEDVVSESSTNTVRMLGALRAAKQCLKCHSVERGDLLGAFSYVLEPTQPVRPKRAPVEPLF